MSVNLVVEVYIVPPTPGAELPLEAPEEEPLAYMTLPAGGTVPLIGDLITLSIGGTKMERLKVVARHHLAESSEDGDTPAHVGWTKIWIFVSHA